MEAFYSQWLAQEQSLLNELSSVPPDRPDLHLPLISRAVALYLEYYNRKSQLANRDIFQVFAGQWLTPFERSFLWLGGFRPSLIFALIPADVNSDQRREIEQLKQQTVERETELEGRMRQLQEVMALLMALTAVHGNVRNGEMRGHTAIQVQTMMRVVFDEAESLRKRAVGRKLEILFSAQAVRFLASVANLHIRTHQYGLRHGSSS